MKSVLNHLRQNPLSFLIVALPLAILAELFHWGPLWIFIFSAIGLVPMAGYIGKAYFVFPRLDQFEQTALTAAIAERLPFLRIQLF